LLFILKAVGNVFQLHFLHKHKCFPLDCTLIPSCAYRATIEGVWKEQDTIGEQKDEGEMSDLLREVHFEECGFHRPPLSGNASCEIRAVYQVK
jgi:hypothetical protein